MTKADAMFEELGYKKSETRDTVMYKYQDTILGDKLEFQIFFSKISKLVFIKGKDGISMSELKAINMKCKELGWEE